ncbi:hypothetical protein G3I60_28410 [Streptomyces sp. SID13666]|uniref:hypothetical protein n=1 Tax=unclassified Streptomyces TaxID=2593676 RepID=UPI0013C27E12|nr:MULTISPECIES: hypothetical protein [unclassified Streptomyces]NEA57977.1 hypothetical protein [Streptomyces sp. SID13666]NEA72835.1 hypothetical protein [Streptomyces sp. SID13588]
MSTETMSTARETLGQLQPAIRTLGRLCEVGAFASLPATDVQVKTTYADGGMRPVVVVSAHEGLSDFEAWREILGIRPEDVFYRELSTSAVLLAQTLWDGVRVEIHAYGSMPVSSGAVAA